MPARYRGIAIELATERDPKTGRITRFYYAFKVRGETRYAGTMHDVVEQIDMLLGADVPPHSARPD